jgi:hypothetical protein
MAVHVENSDGISDSLLFFKSNLPATKVFFRRGYVGNTQKVLMPLFLEITNLSPIVKTSIEYNGYRINCEIPDETFDKRCLDE